MMRKKEAWQVLSAIGEGKDRVPVSDLLSAASYFAMCDPENAMLLGIIRELVSQRDDLQKQITDLKADHAKTRKIAYDCKIWHK